MSRKKIPSQLMGLVSPSVRHYVNSRKSFQRLIDVSVCLRGRLGDYVFQRSHGTQQIKSYEPHKYHNEVNTPLRLRVRTIIRLASEDPLPTKAEKIRILLRSYPFYLKKDKPVNLRLLNFYFPKDVSGKSIAIYRKREGGEADPGLDELYKVIMYERKKTLKFIFRYEEEEWYYAVVSSTGEMSNLLFFHWAD